MVECKITPSGKKGTIEDVDWGQPFFYDHKFWVRTDRLTGTHLVLNPPKTLRGDNYRSCRFAEESGELIEIDLVEVHYVQTINH